MVDQALRGPMRSVLLSYATLVLVMLFWSGNVIVGRAVHGTIPPFTLAFVRWTGATLLALPFALPHLVRERFLLLAHWKPVLLLGLIGIAAFNAFGYSGLRYTTATNGALLQAAIPAFVLLFNRLFFGLKAPALQVGGVLLSIVGVLLVVLQGKPGAILGLHINSGDVLILCGVTCWAAYTSLLRLRPPLHPLTFLVATFVVGILAMAPLSAAELIAGAPLVLSWPVAGAFAYVAIFPSLIAYQLYNAAVHELGAGRTGQTITLMPLFGAFLAALLLAEPLHFYHLTGMVFILAGIAMGAWQARGQPSRP